MAIVTQDQTTKSLNPRMQIPATTCAFQCTKEEYVESKSSGNMMIHRTWQVIQQPEIKVDGANVDVTGTECEQYLVLKKSNGAGGFLDASHPDMKKALGRVFDDYKNVGLPIEEGIDIDNPKLECVGKVVDARLESEEQKRFHPPTAEQIAKGMKVGDPMVDSEGKQVVSFRPRMAFILGPSKVEAQAL